MTSIFWKLYSLAIVSQAAAESQFQLVHILSQQIIDFQGESNTLHPGGTGTDVGVGALGIAGANAETKAVVALKTAVEVNTDNIVNTQPLDRDAALSVVLCRTMLMQ